MKELIEELETWKAKLGSKHLAEYERKLIQCEIAYLQKEIQDRQNSKQKSKEYA